MTSTRMQAQDRPVVFLHGFHSDAGGWVATAERLRMRAAITVHTPTVNWRATFADQVNELAGPRRRSPLFPASSMAIGHSNGGLVAREWARRGSLDGVVTIGTPHRGAPMVPNYGHWVAFNANASWLSSSILTAFSRWTDFAWALGYVNEAIGWVLDFSVWSTVFLGVTLGLDQAIPVAGDMLPYSLFLHNLNSTDNVNHERSTLSTRIGIVSIAHNYFWAGPARVIAPDHADGIATALYAAAYGLMFWGHYILASADIADFDALEQAMSLIALSNHLLAIDPTYCAMVSTMDLSACMPNDGLVPYTSQEYPQAVNLYIGQDNDGPVHTRERETSEDVLYYALVHVAGIPPRSSAPPPPGGGPPAVGRRRRAPLKPCCRRTRTRGSSRACSQPRASQRFHWASHSARRSRVCCCRCPCSDSSKKIGDLRRLAWRQAVCAPRHANAERRGLLGDDDGMALGGVDERPSRHMRACLLSAPAPDERQGNERDQHQFRGGWPEAGHRCGRRVHVPVLDGPATRR